MEVGEIEELISTQYTDIFSEKWKSIERLSEDYAKVAGLTPMGLTVLSIIYENSHDCTQKLICKQSQYNKQSVNMIIKSFWEQGYVELAEMKEDRRNKQVKLSEKGKKYADKVIGLLWKTEIEALEKITSEQRKALIVFLEAYEQCIRNGIDVLAGVMPMSDMEGDDL